MNLLPKLQPRDNGDSRAAVERELIRREAAVGGSLFGPVPEGHNRQFFCLDAHTWIWHEEWNDTKGTRHSVTTRYDVRPNVILKSQNGNPFQPVSKEEARNLVQAARFYYDHAEAEYSQAVA